MAWQLDALHGVKNTCKAFSGVTGSGKGRRMRGLGLILRHPFDSNDPQDEGSVTEVARHYLNNYDKKSKGVTTLEQAKQAVIDRHEEAIWKTVCCAESWPSIVCKA